MKSLASLRFAKGPQQVIYLHIGPHRTGTTTIQRTAEKNAPVMGPDYQVLTNRSEVQTRLQKLVYRLHRPKEARQKTKEIRKTAAALAATLTAPFVIYSQEDLLGPLPGRTRQGLYPTMLDVLPPLIKGLRSTGARIEVAFYRREYGDWLESVFHRFHNNNPPGAYRAARFQAEYNLPGDWCDFEQRLVEACAGATLHALSFEKDRDVGDVGDSLFRLCGLDPDGPDWHRVKPQNVSAQRKRQV